MTAHIASLRSRLADCRLTREQLAALSQGDFSASWLSKFAAGRMRNPRASTLIALERALDQLRPSDGSAVAGRIAAPASGFKECAA